MSKKMMVLALAVACAALFALPAVASAQTWHLGSSTATFSVSGSGGQLTSTAGGSISCTGTTGSGSFSTSTTGSASLSFTGCKGPLGVSCTSAGAATGVISATNEFHAIMVATNKPGLLLTGKEANSATSAKGPQFAEFSCFGLTVKVFGPGVIGTISSPACGVASSTADLVFGSTAQTGHQEDMTYTGATYDLESTITGSHPTASLDGTALITFTSGAQTMTCTH